MPNIVLVVEIFYDVLKTIKPESAQITEKQYCTYSVSYTHLDVYKRQEEMTSAWHKIMAHSDVTLSVDLFDIGIVFFRKELSKQHVAYLPYKYKPWKIGLFG